MLSPKADLSEAPNHPVALSSGRSTEPLLEAPVEEASPDAETDLSRQVNQSLARLEMNSLEVRHYLDAIEEKISRMEPRLEQMRDVAPPLPQAEVPIAIPTPLTSPATPAEAAQNLPPAPAAEPQRRRLDTRDATPRGRRSDDFDPLHNDVAGDLRIWLLSRRRGLSIAAAGLFLFAIILFFSKGPHTSPAIQSSSPASAAPSPTTTASVPPTKAPAGIPLTSSPAPYSEPVRSGSAPTITSPPITAAVIPPTVGSPVPASSEPPSLPAGDATVATPELHQPLPSATGTSLAYGRIRVSSGVMAGNLIYSRPPKYPGGLASLFHTQGRVTMQAVISRSGRVETVRVLSGHRLLRGAAQEAVRTWRYRPYLLNGNPVEVATIVTVDFRR